MKKKFLTLALVLMVAVTLFAARPLEVSGNFNFGYDITFNPVASTAKDASNYSTFVSVTDDLWKITINGGGATVFADEAGITAKADIYLSKALAAEGVDMGDVELTLHAGTGVKTGAPSVFSDKDKFVKIKAEAAKANAGATVKYGSLVEVYGAADLTVKNDFVFGVKTTPVDGVSVALGYGTSKKALAASVATDIKKLADLDFGLAVTAAYNADFANDKSEILANVAGDYAGIGLWVQYGTDLAKHKLSAKASYKTTLEGVTLTAGAKFAIADLANAKLGLTLDASAAYKFGGANYKLALEYVLDGAFTVSPSVSIAF
ncbi:MAG TPA: hypothetical protein PLD69_09280 [Sphaerochaeta sp.]|nr:hypothetical protein [Sphaerochaeta sp.]HQB06112.1 hypothetical protein [Sphaerochaeta sp.]